MLRLPQDRARRTLVLAIVTSVLFHLLLLGPFFVYSNFVLPLTYQKRGEPLLVDIAPERPEEKAPLGNPSRPVAPPESRPRPAPPPAPPVTPAPRTPAARPAPPTPPAPTQPPAVAKAEPPSPDAMVKTPEPRPTAPETPSSESNQNASPASPQVASRLPPSMRRQPGGGGGLQGGGRGGVEGEPIPLDTPDQKYQDYMRKVRDKIRANWMYPREAGERNIEGELLIEFHIAKDGRLEYIELRRTSGTDILDFYAMNAIKLASPFPPVPDAIAKEMLAIHGQFRYQIVSGLVNQFLR
jgi:periplasmic protein TonB